MGRKRRQMCEEDLLDDIINVLTGTEEDWHGLIVVVQEIEGDEGCYDYGYRTFGLDRADLCRLVGAMYEDLVKCRQ